MTAFELLAYVVTFTIVLGLGISLSVLTVMFVNRNRSVKEYKERKEK